ncbi:hypothetical protein [Sulfuritalea sp.]|uniref:hypothetical protein n=1 Tax=Sulfuritalea sp. TaxID=2480090 RepID=UPI00286D6D63|nr:hypothetical protein [Sulfuritalea sp.]
MDLTLAKRLSIALASTLLLPAVPVFAVLAGFSGAGYVISGSTLAHDQAVGFQAAWQAYVGLVANLLSGELGNSLSYGVPVSVLLGKAWTNSALLIVTALVFAFVFGTAASVLAALRPRIMSRVEFVYAFMASVPFVVFLTIAPRDFLTQPLTAQMVAGCALGLYPSLSVFRTISTRIQDLQKAPFVCALRAFGFAERTIWFRIAIRPLAFDAIALGESILAFVFGFLFLAEAAIGVQGLGSIFVSATKRFDYPVLIGCCISVLWLLFLYGVGVEYAARLVPKLNRIPTRNKHHA